jgi:hypothetical protein
VLSRSAPESNRRHDAKQQAIPTPVAPAPAAAVQAATVSQQHVWHTLQAMQAQLDQWRQQKDAFEGQSIGHRQERGQAPEHFVPDDAPFRDIVPVSPLSVELESAPCPRCFNANTLPQYDEYYDPKEFIMKFEAAVESNGGDATTKAKALEMALRNTPCFCSVVICANDPVNTSYNNP